MTLLENIQTLVTEDLWSTFILIAFLLLLRTLMMRALHRNVETLSETRRRWISIVQNTSVVLIGFGLVFIWSPELSTFALSLTAFAVALVIATREFLLCMIGAIYRMVARPFVVGDWIEVGHVRGEVIYEGILTTRLQELGDAARRYAYTGRVLAIPNSMLMTHPIHNESFRKRFIYHVFTITLEPTPAAMKLKPVILETIKKKQVAYEEVAERYWAMVRNKSRTDLPSRKPSVAIETNETARIIYRVTLFCPTNKAIALEQAITESVIEQLHSVD